MSSDPDVASVDASSGLIRAIKPGIAVITARTSDLSFEAQCIVTVVSGYKDSHAYVDMGNGLKISVTNLGAENPWNPGDVFAWGETTARTGINRLSWSSYRFYGGVENVYAVMTKYNNEDGLELLQYFDDAASVYYGSIDWRTMTREDFDELYKCNRTHVSVNGVSGVMFESKENGAKIFFPFSHRISKEDGAVYPYYYPDVSSYAVERTCLWLREKPSRSPSSPDGDMQAYSCVLRAEGSECTTGYRNLLFSIRPVYVGN